MRPEVEENVREMLCFNGIVGLEQDAVIQWFRARDGDVATEILLTACDDGVCGINGFDAETGPVYYFPGDDV
jgi:hypothetical protein